MKKAIYVIYFALTLLLMSVAGALEFVPDCLTLDIDAALFIALYVVPVAYFLHGVISGCFMLLGLKRRAYFLTAPLLTVLTVALCVYKISKSLYTEYAAYNKRRGNG